MKVQLQLPGILKRLPAAWSLPATFTPFTAFCAQHRYGQLGWFHVKWRDPTQLFEADVKPHVVPFMRLPDGGCIAFWFGVKTPQPPIIVADSEGDRRVIASDWSDFLTRLDRGKTTVPDLDERELARPQYPFPLGNKLKPLTKLNRAFNAWIEQRAPKGAALDPRTSERVRREVLRVMRANKHIDRLIGSTLFVTLTPRDYRITWSAGGERPYPAAADLKQIMHELSTALGRPLERSELHVWPEGLVIFEKHTLLGSEKHQAKWRAKLDWP